MVHTWNWLFIYLPRNKELKRIVLENMKNREQDEIRMEDFILKFDFEQNYIYCDCVEDYLFKHKVVPGRVAFDVVETYLIKGDLDWDTLDETKIQYLD